MATVFRRKKNGKPFGKYLIKFKDEHGQWRTVAGCPTKDASEDRGRHLDNEVERKQNGLVDPFEAPKKVALKDHLEAYERYLLNDGDSKDYVKQAKSRLQRIIDACGFKSISDFAKFDATDRVNKFADDLEEMGISPTTIGHYRTALKGFCNWAVAEGRLPQSPLTARRKKKKGKKAKTDKAPENLTRERRILNSDHFDKLLAHARKGGITHRLTGEQRAWAYMVAAATGFRAGEIASLTPRSFSLDSDPPTVTIRGSISKNGDTVDQPIRPDFAAMLRPWLAGFDPDQRIWPGRWYRRAAEMLKVDLDAAEIKQTTAKGVCDFHSFRSQYITALVRAGVPMKVCQDLARHSTITLTAKFYSKTDTNDSAKALDKLPATPSIERMKGA